MAFLDKWRAFQNQRQPLQDQLVQNIAGQRQLPTAGVHGQEISAIAQMQQAVAAMERGDPGAGNLMTIAQQRYDKEQGVNPGEWDQTPIQGDQNPYDKLRPTTPPYQGGGLQPSQPRPMPQPSPGQLIPQPQPGQRPPQAPQPKPFPGSGPYYPGPRPSPGYPPQPGRPGIGDQFPGIPKPYPTRPGGSYPGQPGPGYPTPIDQQPGIGDMIPMDPFPSNPGELGPSYPTPGMPQPGGQVPMDPFPTNPGGPGPIVGETPITTINPDSGGIPIAQPQPITETPVTQPQPITEPVTTLLPGDDGYVPTGPVPGVGTGPGSGSGGENTTDPAVPPVAPAVPPVETGGPGPIAEAPVDPTTPTLPPVDPGAPPPPATVPPAEPGLNKWGLPDNLHGQALADAYVARSKVQAEERLAAHAKTKGMTTEQYKGMQQSFVGGGREGLAAWKKQNGFNIPKPPPSFGGRFNTGGR